MKQKTCKESQSIAGLSVHISMDVLPSIVADGK